MNAAYQVGLQFLSIGMRRAVAACVPVSGATHDRSTVIQINLAM
jgi:hypothetical protein